MSNFSGPRVDDEEETLYVTSDGRLVRTAKEAIEANLGFEESSDTGAGCGQDSDNIDDSD